MRGSAIQGPGKGGALSLVLIVRATAEEYTVYITNRDINPGYSWSDLFLKVSQATADEVHRVYCKPRDINSGYVGAMHCYKAPLWGRRLDLGSLNTKPPSRSAHML